MRVLTIDAEHLRQHLPAPDTVDRAWPVVLFNAKCRAIVLVQHVHERIDGPEDFSAPWLVITMLGVDCKRTYEWQLTAEGFVPYPYEAPLGLEDDRGPFRSLHVDAGTGEIGEPGSIGMAQWSRTVFIFSGEQPEWRPKQPEGELTVVDGFEAAGLQALHEHRRGAI